MKNKTQKQNEPIFVHAWKMSFFSSRKDFMFFLPRNKQQQQKKLIKKATLVRIIATLSVFYPCIYGKFVNSFVDDVKNLSKQQTSHVKWKEERRGEWEEAKKQNNNNDDGTVVL